MLSARNLPSDVGANNASSFAKFTANEEFMQIIEGDQQQPQFTVRQGGVLNEMNNNNNSRSYNLLKPNVINEESNTRN